MLLRLKVGFLPPPKKYLYVHFPKVNHVPVEFVDFGEPYVLDVTESFCLFLQCFVLLFAMGFVHLTTWGIYWQYGFQNWDRVGIARLVIFSVQKHDVFWGQVFFSATAMLIFCQFWKSWQPKDVRMMWWDRLFEAKKTVGCGWIGPGWARHGQQKTWVRPVELVANGPWLFEFKQGGYGSLIQGSSTSFLVGTVTCWEVPNYTLGTCHKKLPGNWLITGLYDIMGYIWLGYTWG